MEYLVILIAALFHAVWNSMVKDSHDSLMSLAAIRTIGLLFGLVVVFLLPSLKTAAIPYLISASLVHLLYFWFLLNTYRVGNFSQVYPISRGSAPLIVLLLGAVYAGEHLMPIQIVATVMISLGILSLSIRRGSLEVVPVSYAAGTACCIAGYTVISGIGVRIAGSFLVYAGWLEGICGFFVLLFTICKRKRQSLHYLRYHWKQGMMAGIFSVGGFAAALWAMTSAPLAPVAALRETSILFAAIIGVFKFKEGHAGQRLPAALIVVCGISLLVFFP